MTFLRTALVFAVLNPPVFAQGKNPHASDAWSPILPGGVAVYAMLRIRRCMTPMCSRGRAVREKVELRKVTRLRRPSHTIPAYGSVELKAGGPSCAVTELKGQPKAGDTVNLTLDDGWRSRDRDLRHRQVIDRESADRELDRVWLALLDREAGFRLLAILRVAGLAGAAEFLRVRGDASALSAAAAFSISAA